MSSRKVKYIGKDSRVRGATVEGVSYEVADNAPVILLLPSHAAHVLTVGEPTAWVYVAEESAPAAAADAPTDPNAGTPAKRK